MHLLALSANPTPKAVLGQVLDWTTGVCHSRITVFDIADQLVKEFLSAPLCSQCIQNLCCRSSQCWEQGCNRSIIQVCKRFVNYSMVFFDAFGITYQHTRASGPTSMALPFHLGVFKIRVLILYIKVFKMVVWVQYSWSYFSPFHGWRPCSLATTRSHQECLINSWIRPLFWITS